MGWEWTGRVVREVFAGPSNAEESLLIRMEFMPSASWRRRLPRSLVHSSHLHGNQPNDAKSRRAVSQPSSSRALAILDLEPGPGILNDSTTRRPQFGPTLSGFYEALHAEFPSLPFCTLRSPYISRCPLSHSHHLAGRGLHNCATGEARSLRTFESSSQSSNLL